MNQENVGKRVTWGKQKTTGTIMACVPAGSSVDAIARGKRIVGVPRFVEDRAGEDRYLVRGDQAGRRKALWWAPQAEEVDAALADSPGATELLTYPVCFEVPMPDALRCAKCGGVQLATLDVWRSGYAAGTKQKHAPTCPKLFCDHGVRWEETCATCEAEEVQRIEERTYLRQLCKDVAEALEEVGSHFPTNGLRDVGETPGGDTEDCLDALREAFDPKSWPAAHQMLTDLPADLRRRVREALGIPWPLAFLAVGQERLEDVTADARVAGLGWLATKFEQPTPGRDHVDFLDVLMGRIVLVKANSTAQFGDAARMRVAVGLAWRACRAARAGEEPGSRQESP